MPARTPGIHAPPHTSLAALRRAAAMIGAGEMLKTVANSLGLEPATLSSRLKAAGIERASLAKGFARPPEEVAAILAAVRDLGPAAAARLLGIKRNAVAGLVHRNRAQPAACPPPSIAIR